MKRILCLLLLTLMITGCEKKVDYNEVFSTVEMSARIYIASQFNVQNEILELLIEEVEAGRMELPSTSKYPDSLKDKITLIGESKDVMWDAYNMLEEAPEEYQERKEKLYSVMVKLQKLSDFNNTSSYYFDTYIEKQQEAYDDFMSDLKDYMLLYPNQNLIDE